MSGSGRNAVAGAMLLAVALGAIARGDEPAKEPVVQAPALPPVKSSSVFDRVPRLRERLMALKPENTQAYFLLGEEVAGEAEKQDEWRLARQLFALSFEIARVDRDPERTRALRASALLALASAADAPGERRWVLSLAKLESAQAGVLADPSGASQADSEGLEPGALDAANAIDMTRNGEGRRAVHLLELPGVGELLNRYDRLLDPSGLTGGVEHLRRLMEQWPICPECRNRRSIKDKDGVKLCPTCGGKPGPRLSEGELTAMVRTEAVLLSGSQLSWASQTMVDDGSPLRDLAPGEVAPTYGVSAERAFWRDGMWVGEERPLAGPPAPVRADESSK